MPVQAPYMVQLPARLAPTDLIHPIVAGTPTPAALPGQQLPDYMARAQEGIEAAQTAMKSKQVAAQAQAQAELAKATSQQVGMYNNYVKMTNARTDIDANTKQAYIDLYAMLHGFSYGPSGGTYTPGAGLGPVIAEMQKRILSGQGNTGDISQAITGLYPPLPKAPVTGSNTGSNTSNVVKAPIQKTTTTGTDGDGVTVFGGTLGQ